MAVITIDNGNTIDIAGWNTPITLHVDNAIAQYSSNLPIITITGRGFFGKNDLFCFNNATYISSLTYIDTTPRIETFYDLTAQAVVFTLGITPIAGGVEETIDVQLRVYENSPIFYLRLQSNDTITSTPITIKFNSTLGTITSYFTTAQDYGLEFHSPSEIKTNFDQINSPYNDSANPATPAWSFGQLYYSTNAISVGQYFSIPQNILIDTDWSIIVHADGSITQSTNTTLAAFFFGYNTNWDGLQPYVKWIQCNYYTPPPSHAYNVPVYTYTKSGAGYRYGFAESWVVNRINYIQEHNFPFTVFELDYGWFQAAGDWSWYVGDVEGETCNYGNFQNSGLTVVEWLKQTKGVQHVGCYITDFVDYGASTYASLLAAGALTELDFSGWGRRADPDTGAGQNYIMDMCDNIVNKGFTYCRLDFTNANISYTMKFIKFFSEYIRSISPNFVIENHGALMAPFVDCCRTNDIFRDFAPEYLTIDNLTHTGNDWKEYRAIKYRMMYMSTNKIVDVDCTGGGGEAIFNNAGVAVYETLEHLTEEVQLQFGFGRPEIYYVPGTFPVVGTYKSSTMLSIENVLVSLWEQYVLLPKEVPSKELIDPATFHIKSTYSDGSYIEASLNLFIIHLGTIDTFKLYRIVDSSLAEYELYMKVGNDWVQQEIAYAGL